MTDKDVRTYVRSPNDEIITVKKRCIYAGFSDFDFGKYQKFTKKIIVFYNGQRCLATGSLYVNKIMYPFPL